MAGLFPEKNLYDDDGNLSSSGVVEAARNKDQIIDQATRTSGGTTVIYTVPAGKKLFIVRAEISCSSTINDQVFVNSTVGKLVEVQVIANQNIANSNNFVMPIRLEAGETASLVVGGNIVRCTGIISGWLENA